MPSRINRFEQSLLEVRHHPIFELQTAMDTLLEAVSPFTSIAHATASSWNLKGGNQAAMDAVILEARTKANIAVESQPQERR